MEQVDPSFTVRQHGYIHKTPFFGVASIVAGACSTSTISETLRAMSGLLSWNKIIGERL